MGNPSTSTCNWARPPPKQSQSLHVLCKVPWFFIITFFRVPKCAEAVLWFSNWAVPPHLARCFPGFSQMLFSVKNSKQKLPNEAPKDAGDLNHNFPNEPSLRRFLRDRCQSKISEPILWMEALERKITCTNERFHCEGSKPKISTGSSRMQFERKMNAQRKFNNAISKEEEVPKRGFSSARSHAETPTTKGSY